jgi:hypothetical protein
VKRKPKIATCAHCGFACPVDDRFPDRIPSSMSDHLIASKDDPAHAARFPPMRSRKKPAAAVSDLIGPERPTDQMTMHKKASGGHKEACAVPIPHIEGPQRYLSPSSAHHSQ